MVLAGAHLARSPRFLARTTYKLGAATSARVRDHTRWRGDFAPRLLHDRIQFLFRHAAQALAAMVPVPALPTVLRQFAEPCRKRCHSDRAASSCWSHSALNSRQPLHSPSIPSTMAWHGSSLTDWISDPQRCHSLCVQQRPCVSHAPAGLHSSSSFTVLISAASQPTAAAIDTRHASKVGSLTVEVRARHTTQIQRCRGSRFLVRGAHEVETNTDDHAGDQHGALNGVSVANDHADNECLNQCDNRVYSTSRAGATTRS